MKVFDRDLQRRLVALAALSRPAGKLDSEPRKSIVSAIFQALVHVLILLTCLYAILDLPKEVGQFAAALLMFQISLSGSKAFHNTVQQAGYYDILVNLPISGKSSLEWIRTLFFQKSILPLFLISVLTGWFLEGFSTNSPASIITTSALLFLVAIATIALLDVPLICRLRIPLIWTSMLYVGAAALFFLFITKNSSYGLNASEDNTRKTLEVVTWFFPASWVMPGRISSGGWIIAGAFLSYGIWRWHRMPAEFGHYYSFPGDYFTAFGHFGIGEEWENDVRETSETELLEKEIEPEAEEEPRAANFIGTLEFLQRAEGEVTLGKGWIERLLEKFLNPRERLITHALHYEPPGYSALAKIAVIFAPIVMIISWFIVRVFPAPEVGSFLFVVGSMAFPIFLSALLFPYSNGIGNATGLAAVGSLFAPTFASYPISVRELLRVSQKITLVRGLIFIIIASPLCYLHFTLLGINWAAHACLLAAPFLVLLILATRPVLLFYRLHKAARHRKRFRMKHLVFNTFTILLAPFLLAGLIVTGVGIYSLATVDSGKDDGRWMLLFTFCGILTCALVSKVVFESYHWLLRRRNYDWLKEVS